MLSLVQPVPFDMHSAVESADEGMESLALWKSGVLHLFPWAQPSSPKQLPPCWAAPGRTGQSPPHPRTTPPTMPTTQPPPTHHVHHPSIRYSAVLFLDLRKAFDMVDHDILLHKLESVGLGDSFVNYIGNHLTNGDQVTKVNGEISSRRHVLCGVPQGSILGLLLFIICINSLPAGCNAP